LKKKVNKFGESEKEKKENSTGNHFSCIVPFSLLKNSESKVIFPIGLSLSLPESQIMTSISFVAPVRVLYYIISVIK